MPHKFPIVYVPEGQKWISQQCLTCHVESIVYKAGTRFFTNPSGKLTTSAPKCLYVKPLHKFPPVLIPNGEKNIIQTCEICRKDRIVYASGSRAYFDESTGAKIPYPTACAVVNAKVVSISDFVKTNQIDEADITVRQKFIEAIFILSSVQKFGLNERTTVMIDSFLERLQQNHSNADALTG